MNTQKQITVMVLLVFALLGGCAAYTVYDQNRENDAAAYQTEVHAERGARIYAQYCRQCHGNAGEGRVGPALNRPDLQDANTRNVTTQWVTDTLTCGRIGTIMPPWSIVEGGSLTPEQISDVVTLITTNAGNGWQEAGQFSAQQNQIAPVPSISDVLAAGSTTGGTGSYVCGQKASTPAAGGPASTTPPPGTNTQAAWTVTATDNQFDLQNMAVPAGQPVTVTLNNKGAATHNWQIIDQNGQVVNDDSGKPIAEPLTDGGKSSSITFTLTKPGVYKFQCVVHPTQMIGQIYVVAAGGEAAPTPAAVPATVVPAGAGAGTPAATPTRP